MQTRSIECRPQGSDQLCFIHIPKTAGTTFTSILDAKFSAAEICPARVWSELVDLPTQDLVKYRLLRGHFYYYIHKLLPQKPIYITMLRDPIERIISAYEFMKRSRPSRREALPTHEKALSLSLKDYVCDPTVPGIINAQTRHFTLNLYKEIPDLSDRRWLEDAKEHMEEFTFVGLTEQFQNSMFLLSYIFGWKPPTEYQNLMVAPKRLRQKDLAQDVIDAITDRNQLDIELYQYAKQRFETQYAQMTQELFEKYAPPAEAALDIQRVYQRLEKHYEQRYLELNPTPIESLVFEFDQAMSGSGWHLQEGTEIQHQFRWTGPGTISALDLPLSRAGDLMVEFRVINAIALDVLESLELRVNDHPIHFVTIYSDGTVTIFQGTISQSVLVNDKPFVQLAFKVNRTTSPQSVNPSNPDIRPVGLAFDLIQIFPVGSAAKVSTTAFLFDCQQWKDTVDFVKQHLKGTEQILAPTAFSLKFPHNMAGQPSSSAGKTRNYTSTFENESDFQWVILHKGMKREIGAILRKLTLWGFKPVFANGVFAVFSSSDEIPALSYTSPHIKSLYAGYFKFYIAELIKPLYVNLGNARLYAKKTVKPMYMEKLKPFYLKYFKKYFGKSITS